jgi:hypothetical protein
LRASRIEHGLLVNFGAPKFEIKKYALSQPGHGAGGGGVASAILSVFAAFALFRGLFGPAILTRGPFSRIRSALADRKSLF